MADSLGYETTLHYGSMSFDSSELNTQLDSIYWRNQHAIENELAYAEKEKFDRKLEELKYDGIRITMGGPAQTILTGLIGFSFLIFRKKKIKEKNLNLTDWLFVFLSLFWLREVFNPVTAIIEAFIYNENFSFGGDELYISEYFHLNPGTVPISLGILGLLFSLYTIFKILPRKIQIPFIIAGLIGGLSGYLLWFEFLGPRLLP